MIRTIVGFHEDDLGDWVAELSCLHRQHVRHRPPFEQRPWVLDPQQRKARIGTRIECPLCDRAEMPEDLQLLRTAGPWDQDGIPAGLRRSHRTAAGVWGLLQVLEGRVELRMGASTRLSRLLEAGVSQPIPPTVEHELILVGPARLELQFWGRPPGPGPRSTPAA